MPRAPGILEQIKQVTFADSAGWSRGEVVLRRGFFYLNGMTADRYKAEIQDRLHRARIHGPGNTGLLKAKVVDHGEVWVPYDGGKPVAKQSHWWVRLKLEYAD